MPEYKATVIGENFEFLVDEEPQYLDFTRTVYVTAADESTAHQAALALVREELLVQAMLNDEVENLISVDEICQADILSSKDLQGDFIWYFPDDLYDENE